MARLQSIAKMGYYPTQPEVVRQIRSILRFLKGRFQAIDTYCAEGDALSQLRKPPFQDDGGFEKPEKSRRCRK